MLAAAAVRADRPRARRRVRDRRHDAWLRTRSRSTATRSASTCRPRCSLGRASAAEAEGLTNVELRAGRRPGRTRSPTAVRPRRQPLRRDVLRRPRGRVREPRARDRAGRAARGRRLAAVRSATNGCGRRAPRWRSVAQLPPIPDDVPGPFGLADPDRIRRILDEPVGPTCRSHDESTCPTTTAPSRRPRCATRSEIGVLRGRSSTGSTTTQTGAGHRRAHRARWPSTPRPTTAWFDSAATDLGGQRPSVRLRRQPSADAAARPPALARAVRDDRLALLRRLSRRGVRPARRPARSGHAGGHG